jgi:hypothetical protein
MSITLEANVKLSFLFERKSFLGGLQISASTHGGVVLIIMKYSKEISDLSFLFKFCPLFSCRLILARISFVDFFECVTRACQTSLAREWRATADWHLWQVSSQTGKWLASACRSIDNTKVSRGLPGKKIE